MCDKILCGLGNPLLDIQTTVAPGYLKRFDLDANSQILAEEKHLPMYQELVDWFPVEYIPGGATQNSIRVAQWMLGSSGVSYYVGSIGKDSFGETLKEKVRSASVSPLYFEQDEFSTGTCAALISGNEGHRSLCANLAAANVFKKSHLDKDEIWSKVKTSSIFYSAGFFLTPPEGPQSMLKVGQYASENNKIFATNLSAPFICQFFKDPLSKIIPFCDLIFGNETEAEAFANNFGWNDEKKSLTMSEIAQKIANMEKSNGNRNRTVIITQGSDPTIVATPNSLNEYKVRSVPNLVDTNGAGDAFVGGYLAALLHNHKEAGCVKAAQWAASVIIQRDGCTFPQTSEFKL